MERSELLRYRHTANLVRPALESSPEYSCASSRYNPRPRCCGSVLNTSNAISIRDWPPAQIKLLGVVIVVPVFVSKASPDPYASSPHEPPPLSHPTPNQRRLIMSHPGPGNPLLYNEASWWHAVRPLFAELTSEIWRGNLMVSLFLVVPMFVGG